MSAKVELFLAILLFNCLVLINPLGTSLVFSSGDDGDATKYNDFSEKTIQTSEPDAEEKTDDLVYTQGDESGSNTLYGYLAGVSITSGENNSFFGHYAGYRNTSGESNAFFGEQAGVNNLTADANSFFGQSAGVLNETGEENAFFGAYAGANNKASFNSFFGMSSGNENTTGAFNAFFGCYSGYKNTGSGAVYNSFFGYQSGYSNINGNRNSFFGSSAGYGNTSGIYNSFFGASAGIRNTTGNYNTFIGHEAGGDQQNPLTGNSNVFVGQRTGWKNTSGHSNTFLGRNAGAYNTEGSSNTFVGRAAGFNTKTVGVESGDSNTFIGRSAGAENLFGDNNTFLGALAGYNTESGSGNVFIGNKAGYPLNDSNKLYIENSDGFYPLIWGDFAENKVRIYGDFRAFGNQVFSDARLKKNVFSLGLCLEKISKLNAVGYEWKTNEYPNLGMSEGKQIGLIAQNVEEVFPELVSEDSDGIKAVSYSKLTAVLVGAVKELKAENQKREGFLIEQLKKQQAEIEELRSMIKELKS